MSISADATKHNLYEDSIKTTRHMLQVQTWKKKKVKELSFLRPHILAQLKISQLKEKKST